MEEPGYKRAGLHYCIRFVTPASRSKRDFELNKATYDTEVNTAKAEAEMAYGLQEAKVRSKIKEEEMQVR